MLRPPFDSIVNKCEAASYRIALNVFQMQTSGNESHVPLQISHAHTHSVFENIYKSSCEQPPPFHTHTKQHIPIHTVSFSISTHPILLPHASIYTNVYRLVDIRPVRTSICCKVGRPCVVCVLDSCHRRFRESHETRLRFSCAVFGRVFYSEITSWGHVWLWTDASVRSNVLLHTLYETSFFRAAGGGFGVSRLESGRSVDRSCSFGLRVRNIRESSVRDLVYRRSPYPAHVRRSPGKAPFRGILNAICFPKPGYNFKRHAHIPYL